MLKELTKVVRTRKEPGLISFLVVLHNIFYRKTDNIPAEVLQSIEKAIIDIEKQTAYSENMNDEWKLKENIEVRCRCSALAFQIYLYEKRVFGEDKHSEATLHWKEICCGSQARKEFSEVRNEWLAYMN